MGAPAPHRRWNYDVLLSFRGGDDTCKNFVGHLHYALMTAGIKTFQDDNPKDHSGENIVAKLVQNSRFCVVVFSRNLAASTYCLDQLVNIMGCKRTAQQKVFPVFYDVDPSDVRKQGGSFAEAFAEHEKQFMLQKERVSRWRAALTEAANLSGWDLRNLADGHEAKFIREIVQHISRELNNTYLFVAVYPVGLDSRLEVLNSMLQIGSDDVRIIGICGMGGIGKTTIAKAAYNKFFHCFEGQCFLANVRENSKQPNGRIRLQERLLSDVLKADKVKLSSVDMGIYLIQQKLSGRRVLVILDAVDSLDELNTLVGMRDWFGLGSRIIITTRDEHLLKQYQVNEIYFVEQLRKRESLELFSFHAFGKAYLVDDYVELSKRVVSYSEGLPLVLIVLGSFLFKRSLSEWRSALDKLERIPDGEVLKKLRISFDALSDPQEKDIFCDIACFFTNMSKDYVVTILNGCGLSAENGISVLVNRCLLTMNEKNKLMMHDLLRDMGREIVREECVKDPGKRSRLWHYEDVLGVLQKHMGARAVRGLVLNLPMVRELQFSSEAFVKMNNLRLLKLNHVHLTGDYGKFSKELRWLCWHKFPLRFIPTDFDMENLVALDMRHSNLLQVWKTNKILGKLKVLNLSHSPYLSRTPNFLCLPSLEKLILKDCGNLVELHQSVGSLERLTVINVKDCESLGNLPRSISSLKSLQILNLSGCLKIDELPEDIGDMESLRELVADGIAIRTVPDSIVKLRNLTTLSLSGCNAEASSSSLRSRFWPLVSARRPESSRLLPASVAGLICLTTLKLENCNLSDDALPHDIDRLLSLKTLHLGGNNFHDLPERFKNLPKLQTLDVCHCTNLRSLPMLPSTLESLRASDCTSLEKISLNPVLSKVYQSPVIQLHNCENLVEILGFTNLDDTKVWLLLMGCNSLSRTFRESVLQGWSRIDLLSKAILPGTEIPRRFTYQGTGPSLTFQMPPTLNRKLYGFTVCVVYCLESAANHPPSVAILNLTKDLGLAHEKTFVLYAPVGQDHICLATLRMNLHKCTVDEGDVVHLTVYDGFGYNIKKCALHLVFTEETRMDIQTYGELEGNKVTSTDANAKQGKSHFLDEKNDDVGSSSKWSDEELSFKRMRYDHDPILNEDEMEDE